MAQMSAAAGGSVSELPRDLGAGRPAQSGRVGIDVGGTHTDIVVLDASGNLVVADKVPSDPAQP